MLPLTPIVDATMAGVRGSRLQWKFGVLSLVTTALLLVLAGVAVRSVAISHRSATDAARADLAALEDASNLQDLLYQKGFVSEYFLTGDRKWLDELGRTRADFDRWVAAVTRNAGATQQTAATTGELVAEYGRYDADRARAIAEFDAGQRERAVATLVSATARVPRLRAAGARPHPRPPRRGDGSASSRPTASGSTRWSRSPSP